MSRVLQSGVFRRSIRLLRAAGAFILTSGMLQPVTATAQPDGAALIDTAATCARYMPKEDVPALALFQPALPLDALGQCIAALQTLQQGAATDLRDAEILKLIGEGKKEEAEKLQLQSAQDDKAAGIARSRKVAERYRGIAATAGLADRKKARDYYGEAAKLDPDNVDGMFWHGAMEQLADNFTEAERAYSAVLAIGVKGRNDFVLYGAALGLGDIRCLRLKLEAALAAYRDALAEAERLAKADPGNLGWQRELSVSYSRVGYVLRLQGDLAGALSSHKDALSIYERLAKAGPGNTLWQGDLWLSQDSVGGVLRDQGKLTEALKALQASLSTAERLAKADPGNATWQRYLRSTHFMLGGVLQAQGDLAGALASFKVVLSAYERLAEADPGNELWQRFLSGIQERVGNVLLAQGDLAGALSMFERRAKAYPDNGPSQIRVAEIYWRLAETSDNPKEIWTKVVAILKALDAKGMFDPAAKTQLEQAEANLAEADRAPTK